MQQSLGQAELEAVVYHASYIFGDFSVYISYHGAWCDSTDGVAGSSRDIESRITNMDSETGLSMLMRRCLSVVAVPHFHY